MDPVSDSAVLKTVLFYITHLNPASESDIKDIESFSVDRNTGRGLLEYLKHQACIEEDSHEMRTYLVRDVMTKECAAFFSLKAGLISINEKKSDNNKNEEVEKEFDTLPGIELANFAVNTEYIKNHPKLKGIGKYIFGAFIIPLTRIISEYIGVKMVYIFALPYESLIKRYSEYGFQSLSDSAESSLHRRLKPRYDRFCKFMYMLLEK